MSARAGWHRCVIVCGIGRCLPSARWEVDEPLVRKEKLFRLLPGREESSRLEVSIFRIPAD